MIERDIERMIQAISAKGLRITEQRRTLVRLFAESSGLLAPKEVYSKLEAKHPGLSYDTVYRNLRTLQDLGVLEQFHFEDGVKFRIGCYGTKRHHHHLICLECNKVIPLSFCPMDQLEFPETFQIVRHRFEVYGYCLHCLKRGHNKTTKTISA